MDGVRLTIEEDALREVAHESLERKTGARGLRAIMEKTVMDPMYEVPSDKTITECIIRRENVGGAVAPEMVHGRSEKPELPDGRKKKTRTETA